MRPLTTLLAALLVATLSAGHAAAQDTRGSIEGVVKDGSGGVLPGATVEARSPRLVGVQSTTADANGNYRFPALPPRPFEVTANLQGFASKKAPGNQLGLGQTLKVDFA